MKTTGKFIEEASNVHNYLYNYAKVNYKNNRTNIIIICPKHGEFLQSPTNHLSGQNCPKCKGKLKLTTEEFIKRSIKIHGNLYDYNEVNYVDCYTKVKIVCKIHGAFDQNPKHHYKGSGCPKCFGTFKSNTEEFIEKAKLIHGNKYNYGNVNYLTNKIKITITCDKHGDFIQNPLSHLQGQGCIKCSGLNKLTTEEFIKKANNIHSSLYNYDLSEYINTDNKVKILCKKHGEFLQTPHCHLEGQGCPSCKKSLGEIKIENILKKNNTNYKTQYSFEDLKFKKKLHFDFGILDDSNNLLFLLEYNGQQHYEIFDLFHKSIIDFEESKHRDQLKQDYCKKNNIPLYIIKYDENINEAINNIFEYEIST